MLQFKPGANYAIFKKPGKQNPAVYKISEITDALDVEDSDVVKVIDNYVSNKMKWNLYERFMEKYYDEKDIKRSEAETLFG